MPSRFYDGLVRPAVRALAWLAVWAAAAALLSSPLALVHEGLNVWWAAAWVAAACVFGWLAASAAVGRPVVDHFKTRPGSRTLGRERRGRYRE